MQFSVKLLFSLFLFLFSFGVIDAQEGVGKDYWQNLSENLEEMTPEQKKALLAFAVQKADIKTDKLLKKMTKKMEGSDLEQLLLLASKGADFEPTRTNKKASRLPDKDVQLPITTIEIDNPVHRFGKVSQGERVSHTFKLTNTGEEPLKIAYAKGSCGCTVPKWPQTPIPPGETAEIDVEFNSAGRKGGQSKVVTVIANTDPKQTLLTIYAEVVVKE
jgi:hypothetical protein